MSDLTIYGDVNIVCIQYHYVHNSKRLKQEVCEEVLENFNQNLVRHALLSNYKNDDILLRRKKKKREKNRIFFFRAFPFTIQNLRVENLSVFLSQTG